MPKAFGNSCSLQAFVLVVITQACRMAIPAGMCHGTMRPVYWAGIGCKMITLKSSKQ